MNMGHEITIHEFYSTYRLYLWNICQDVRGLPAHVGGLQESRSLTEGRPTNPGAAACTATCRQTVRTCSPSSPSTRHGVDHLLQLKPCQGQRRSRGLVSWKSILYFRYPLQGWGNSNLIIGKIITFTSAVNCLIWFSIFLLKTMWAVVVADCVADLPPMGLPVALLLDRSWNYQRKILKLCVIMKADEHQ